MRVNPDVPVPAAAATAGVNPQKRRDPKKNTGATVERLQQEVKAAKTRCINTSNSEG